MDVTIGITTHNRANSLGRLMQSLCQLECRQGDSIEIVVAANACTDDTVKVLQSYRSRLRLKIIEEAQLGISFGRNAIVDNSNGDIILWTDDDVTVGPDWASNYADFFEKHPDVDFAGGPIEPVFEGARQPEWIKAAIEHLPSSYAKLDLGQESRPFQSEHFEAPYGANMAIRTKLPGCEPFDTQLGRVGQDDLSGGEESKYFNHLTNTGHQGWWLGHQTVSHWIDEKRQSLRYLKDYWFHVGRDEAQISTYNRSAKAPALPPHKRQWKMVLLWLRYWKARTTADPENWIPALGQYQLERGRSDYLQTDRNSI